MTRTVSFLLLFAYSVHFIVAAPPEKDLFPFGLDKGDLQIPTTVEDAFAGPFQLKRPFQFFNRSHSSLYVDLNGVISFADGISQSTPTCGPVSPGLSMITPFWADVNIGQGLGGSIFYRETVDRESRVKASQEIQAAFPELWGISVDSLFITTWHRVTFSGANTCGWSNKTVPTNTFQLALASGGVHSFAIIYYSNIDWTTGRYSGGNCSGLGGAPAKAGLDAGDGKTFFGIPGSCTSDIIKVADTSNIGQPGKWIFRVDKVIESVSCNSQLYEKQQLEISPSFTDLFGQIPIALKGPCFNESYSANCTFHDGTKLVEVPAQIIVDQQTSEAVCFVPHLYTQGRIQVDLTLHSDNDTQNYTGYIYAQGFDKGVQIQVYADSEDNVFLNVTWNRDRFEKNASLEFALYDLDDEWTEKAVIGKNIPNSGQVVLAVPEDGLNGTGITMGSLRVPRDQVDIRRRQGGGTDTPVETSNTDHWVERVKQNMDTIRANQEKVWDAMNKIDWDHTNGHEEEIHQQLANAGWDDWYSATSNLMGRLNEMTNQRQADYYSGTSYTNEINNKRQDNSICGKTCQSLILNGLIIAGDILVPEIGIPLTIAKWIKRAGSLAKQVRNARGRCDKFLSSDPGSSTNGGPPFKDVEPAPPTLMLAQNDFRFEQSYSVDSGRYQIFSQRVPSPSGAFQRAGYLDGKLMSSGYFAQGPSLYSLSEPARITHRFPTDIMFMMDSSSGVGGLVNHVKNDIMPMVDCCILSLSPDRCKGHGAHRPSNNGSGYKPPHFAHGCHAHFTSFDATSFTFNGAGEFWMIKNTKRHFQMQVRMEQFLKPSGGLAASSVFTAFAMRQGESRIQVQLSSTGTGIDVYLDGTLINSASVKKSSTIATHAVAIEISNDQNKVVASFSSGFSFAFTRADYSLTFLSLADKSLQNTTSGGLLGSFDANPGNDLETPNGVVISLESSTEKIHHDFGLKWMIFQQDSLFLYGKGKSYEVYKNEKFIPSFSVPDVATLPSHVIEMCSGEFECLYDYAMTNSTAMANQTRIISQGHKRIMAIFHGF